MQETGKRKETNFGTTHRRCFSLLILALLIFTGMSQAFELSVTPHYNGGDGTYTTTTRDGQTVWIPSSYLYFSAPGFPASVQSAYLEITYYDEPEGPRMVVQYDSDYDDYTMSDFHTRSSGEGTDTFVKSYHRLDNPGFTDRQNGGSDFRINGGGFPIKSMVVRDTPFSDPYAAYALSHNPPWLSPYSGPSRDDVNASTIKGKVVTGYQGWFKAPNDLYDSGWRHWGFDGNGNSTVDMWPNPAHYDPGSLHPAPGMITVGAEQGYVFSSGDPAVVNKHFEWMRKYNIDGVYLQRFANNSTAGTEPEWVLALVRQAAHLHGRVWAIEYDVSGGTDANLYDKITTDWKWLVDEVGVTNDSRYLHEGGKPVVVIWGAGIRVDKGITQVSMDPLVDFFQDDPVYGDNYVVGCVKNTFPSDWDSHNAKYDSIFAWMGSQTNVATHAAQYGINAQVHVWPGFSWQNLKQYVFPHYTPRESGDFFWGKISNGINIIDPETVFVGMFDEYDEGTAIMPMSDDPPVVPYPNIPNTDGDIDWGYYITNTDYDTGYTSPSDWWMTLTGQAKEMLCDQRSFSFSTPAEAPLENRSNIGPELTVDLGATDIENLLYWYENLGDGTTVTDVIDGVTCRRATNNYMYFDVDDAFMYQVSAGEDVTIIVDYYDTSDAVTIGLNYDSVSAQWQTHPKSFTTSGTNTWRTVRFEIDDAYFGNRENGGDFRLCSDALYNMNIARVRVVLEQSSVYAAMVPDVVGLAQATAESDIVLAGLVVGRVITAYSSSVSAGEVIIQSPTNDSLVTVGSSVDLFVSTDTFCAGLADFDCDGIVDAGDFSYMAGVWLTADAAADIALPADGIVDVQDLLVLVQEWLDGSQAVAYWNFDETAGSVASDSSENGFNGTLIHMDNSDWVPGNTGNALDFDGKNDHVAVDNVCASLAGKDITISAWVKAPAVNTAHQFMVSINSSNGTNNKIMLGTYAGSDTLSLYESGWHDTTTTVIDNTWHHIAYVLEDSSNTITIYVGGSDVSSFASTASVVAADVFSLGQEYDAGMATGDFYSGQLDDVRIYARALSEAEIAELAQ